MAGIDRVFEPAIARLAQLDASLLLLTVLVAGATIPLLAACGGSATAIVTASTTRTTTVAATPSLASTTSRTAAAPATSAATTTSATTTSAAAAPVATAAPTQPVAAGSKLVFWNATEGTVTGYEQGDKNGFLDYFRAKHPEIQLEADYFPDIYTKYEKSGCRRHAAGCFLCQRRFGLRLREEGIPHQPAALLEPQQAGHGELLSGLF